MNGEVPFPRSTPVSVVVPVPPLRTGRTPVMSVVRSTSAVATTPAVAFKKPVREPKESEVTVVVARVEVPVATRFVVVAFVAVKLVMVPVTALSAVVKKLVEVALTRTVLVAKRFVVVELTAVTFVNLAVRAVRSVLKKFVEVALTRTASVADKMVVVALLALKFTAFRFVTVPVVMVVVARIVFEFAISVPFTTMTLLDVLPRVVSPATDSEVADVVPSVALLVATKSVVVALVSSAFVAVRLVAKRFVVVAFVAVKLVMVPVTALSAVVKKLVEVALTRTVLVAKRFVVVELTAVTFVNLAVRAVRSVLKKFVEVALTRTVLVAKRFVVVAFVAVKLVMAPSVIVVVASVLVPITPNAPPIETLEPSSVIRLSTRTLPAALNLANVFAVPVAEVSTPKVFICAIPAERGVVNTPVYVASTNDKAPVNTALPAKVTFPFRLVSPETVSVVAEILEFVMREFVISTSPKLSILCVSAIL